MPTLYFIRVAAFPKFPVAQEIGFLLARSSKEEEEAFCLLRRFLIRGANFVVGRKTNIAFGNI